MKKPATKNQQFTSRQRASIRCKLLILGSGALSFRHTPGCELIPKRTKRADRSGRIQINTRSRRLVVPYRLSLFLNVFRSKASASAL
jgi:hypothetical protein